MSFADIPYKFIILQPLLVKLWTKHFGSCCHCAEVNSMVLDLINTKEIVFQQPCPKHHYLSQCLDDIEQLNAIKSLGIMLQQGLSFELHVQSYSMVM